MAKHEFQTEVGQLLQLMTHSLYSNKEIFIRELVSNASDAIDKLNYLRLTDDNLKESYQDWSGQVNIKIDEEDNSITIMDNGIGMNEEDLIASIGTIAKSGTKSFVEALSGDAKKDSNLIGQFGVGFYSVFMVANQVDVISKKDGEETAYKWSSDGTGSFDLAPCIKETSGTVIYIKLKEDEVSDYTSKHKVETVVKKICDFKQSYTQYGGVRPFGTALLIVGIDSQGKYLFETDPSGALMAYKAGGIGSGRNTVMEIFEEKYKENMTMDEAIKLGLQALHQATEGELDVVAIEMGVVKEKEDFRKMPHDEVQTYVQKHLKNDK